MTEDRTAATRALVEIAGLPSITACEPLAGGANNRVYRLDTGGQSVVLKSYFHDTGEPWDRMQAEWEFMRFAWDIGLRNVPEPLAADNKHRLALYGYVTGRPLQTRDVDAGSIAQAVAFFSALNRHRLRARNLRAAAESCFSIGEHLSAVDRRLRDLMQIPGTSSEIEDSEAKLFVGDALRPAWQSVRSRTVDLAGSGIDASLEAPLRCVSPSDFGFHNAILASNGTLYFIDFEYGGWDDPAKLIADFFCQVALPVPLEYFADFAQQIAWAVGDRGNAISDRAVLLLPVYTIKWCCILLNEFGPAGRDRRDYAGTPTAKRKREQLRKASALMERLNELSV